MAHNNSRIYIDTGQTPNIGVSIADIQAVLGRGVNDLGLLCSDKEWVENNGTDTLQDVNKINPMARHKPVRSPLMKVLEDTDFAGTRFGFGTATVPTLGGTFEAVWVYLKPRGKHGTATNPGTSATDDEWYRARDFDGYWKDAVAPLRVENMGCYYGDEQYPAVTGRLSMLLKFNGSVDGWMASDCIKFRELLVNGNSLWGYYIAFLFIDTDGSEKNFVVTGYKLSDVLINDDMQWGFSFSQIQQTQSGQNMPAVPILNSGNLGHNILCIFCLSASGATGTNLYDVYTEATSPTASQMGAQAYSVAFVQNCDRALAVLRNRISMSGTTGSISTFSLTYSGTTNVVTESPVRVVAYKYSYTVRALIDTTGCTTRWAYDACSVQVIIRVIVFDINNAGVYMSPDGNPSNHSYTNMGEDTDTGGVYFEYETNERLWNNDSRSYPLVLTNDFPWLAKTGTTTASAKIKISAVLRQYSETDISLGESAAITITQ